MDLRERDCPLCSSSISMTLSSGSTYLYPREFQSTDTYPAPVATRCMKCELVYLNPIMTDEEYEKFYNNDEQRKFISDINDEFYEKVRKNDEYRVKLVKKYMMDNMIEKYDRVLDVGTGYSNFISYFDHALGLDISEARIEHAKEKGLRVVHLEDFYNLYMKRRYNIITMFHVLEHIPEPFQFLNNMSNVLAEYGRLIIEVPNLNDALVKLDNYKKFYYQNAHCSYFTPRTLEKLLDKAGFKIDEEIKLQRYSLDNHLHWLLKKKPGKYKRLAFMNSPYSFIMKKFNVHDTIFMVCMKK